MRSFVLFKISAQLYAVDIEMVRRILPSSELTEVPDEPSHIEGMFQYEGEVLKVLSFRKLLGLDELKEKKREHQRCLIIKNETDSFGINIDAVEDIIYIKDDYLHKPTQVQGLGEFMSVEAILEHENALVTIVKDIRMQKA